jgi:hypothetical protein
MNNSGFKLPKQFLTQLGEFSRGYYMAIVNDRGEIESFESYDNPVIRLALLSFMDVQVSAMQQSIKNQALRMEERGTQLPGDDDDFEDQQD